MNEFQHTLKQPAELEGIGLHTGQSVKVRICPSEANTGIIFHRIDLEGDIRIKADVDYVSSVERGTTLERQGVKVATVEHVLAALFGCQVDNAVIEINGEEIPILDGSSKPFVDAILEAGLEEQGEEREYYEVRETIRFYDEEKDAEILVLPDSTFKSTVLIDYQSNFLGQQHASLEDVSEFNESFSEARTFCFLHELESLLDRGLIKGGDLNNAIVVVDHKLEEDELNRLRTLFNKPDVEVEQGILNNVELRYPNECARHKLLDFVGDLALAGMPIKGNFIATRPGHSTNVAFAKSIKAKIKAWKAAPQAPTYDQDSPPLYDLVAIQKLLPHRYPFLLVDKIVHLDKKEVVGVKSVTFNEYYFRGHFPNNPVMPGVLQIEAMAQVGGIFALSQVEDDGDYDTYFLKIQKARFKAMVVPGDTLIIQCILMSPIRRGLVEMRGLGFVGSKLVVEAELMAKIQKRE
ncbi:MAG: bifunctional UDP-3-O-[3-hydroxymyristoyl] N-acetylglucosamine deacetylase/3-hydroxyacyl-ACP dehydratase [Bacteroidota bacterium]|nr:bifunctional UDP-3-O-[3-hydroxymyristoyl] N-acetylglucosamine deacetylase/3-hydroxyacyl-ACP dehydratase [Bacteroidota bacterium]MEC7405270.1 bifunctional UDP-3-O-[3-hydroxymyristoyl] N-acetylglucosamine deacetylase/3-hydroxyacyl-ACP dehydratase [Bacteroidota bacterium]MEC8032680.1 bifunctional UDP-3-O-[3-hydroxymyristoyl] N-acetylglucosamine deacetylase/3-hydroxyacyl-ACP dehydratase [Bacteroidota bacterium]MEC8757652.1 bifunctional UDP-3-O-[3-hydroxymyristoyl] N-acetylglucosamine deacetylase/